MESRWYVPPGKTLKTTQIKDRKHELHVSKEKWEKITGHLDRNRLMKEAIEAEENRKQAMRETAEAMTKNWTDCLKNIKQKEMPDSDDKIAKNLELFNKLRKEQGEERKIYVEEMRKKIAKHTEFPKALSSALLLSEVVYERSKQIELDQKLKAHERDMDNHFAELVKKGAGDEIRENREKEMKRLEKAKAHAKELKETFEQSERERIEENRQRVEQESKEYEMAKREELLLKEFEHKEIMRRRKERKEINEEQMKQIEEYKKLKKKETEEQDAFSKIIQNYRDRIVCLSMRKSVEEQETRMKRAVEFGKKLAVAKSNQDEIENQLIAKYNAAKDAEAERKLQAEKEKREKTKEVLINARMEHLERVRKEEADSAELKKWQMLNNCKSNDETKKFEDDLKQAEIDKSMKTKEGWDADLAYKKSLKDIEEANERRALEEEQEALQKEDDFFYTYAKEVTDFAKSRGRITYPIESVVKRHRSNILKIPPKQRPCVHETTNQLVNKTPGKMAHDPKTDPNYIKTKCKCCCHRDVLYK